MLAHFAWSIELRLWVASCVTFLSAFSSRALGLTLQPLVLVCIYASTVAIYNLDGSFDDFEQRNESRRNRFLIHVALTAVALTVAVVSALALPWPATALILTGLACCSLYAVRLPRPRTALKAVFGLKAPFVGTAVGVAVVWVPLMAAEPTWTFANGAWVWKAFALTLSLSLFCTANATLFDVPDLEEDTRQGVPTLPRVMGLPRTKLTIVTLCLLGLITFGTFRSLFDASSAWGIFVLGFFLLLATAFVRRHATRDSVALWIDGALILPYVVQSLA